MSKELKGLQGTDFLNKLKEFFMMISGDSLTNLSIDSEGLDVLKELLVGAGFELNKFGAIKVDGLMRTSDFDVFAIGDCAGKKDFITRKDNSAMLASVAGAESKFLAENLFETESSRNSLGTMRIFSTSLNGEKISLGHNV